MLGGLRELSLWRGGLRNPRTPEGRGLRDTPVSFAEGRGSWSSLRPLCWGMKG